MSNSWWIAYIWHLWWRWVSTSATKRFSAPQWWGFGMDGMGPSLPGRGATSITGWWFGTWVFWLSIQLGMSSSQLLLTPSFFGGVGKKPPTSLIWTEGYQGELTNSHDRPWWTFWPSMSQRLHHLNSGSIAARPQRNRLMIWFEYWL